MQLTLNQTTEVESTAHNIKQTFLRLLVMKSLANDNFIHDYLESRNLHKTSREQIKLKLNPLTLIWTRP